MSKFTCPFMCLNNWSSLTNSLIEFLSTNFTKFMALAGNRFFIIFQIAFKFKPISQLRLLSWLVELLNSWITIEKKRHIIHYNIFNKSRIVEPQAFQHKLGHVEILFFFQVQNNTTNGKLKYVRKQTVFA
jgi:hypothetical protein